MIISLFEHDLFEKPVSTFSDHAWRDRQPIPPCWATLRRGHLGQLGERLVERSLIVGLVLELTCKIGDVGAHVEVPMTRQIEQDGFALALLLSP